MMMYRKNRFVASCLVWAALTLGFVGTARADRVDRLIRDLGYSNYKVRLQAAYGLGLSKDKRAVAPLVEALKDSEYSVRGAAAIALGNLKFGEAIDGLTRALSDEEEFVQAEAAKALGRIGDKRAIDPLVGVIEDKKSSWKVRLEAVKGLGGIGDKRSVEILVRVYEDEIDTGELGDAIRAALKRLRGEVDVPAFVQRLSKESADKHERAQAALALGVVADPRGFDPLLRALEDRELYVRYSAVRALATYGDPRAVDPLSRALDREEHPRLRHYLYLCLVGLRRKAR